jgi:hypothetical protein
MRSRALRDLPGPARPDHGERHRPVHAGLRRPRADRAAGDRPAGRADGGRRVRLLAARDRHHGRDGSRCGQGRQVPRHPAGAGPACPGGRRRGGRRLPRPRLDRPEHHVRLPHARSGSGTRPGPDRGGAALPLRAAGASAQDARDLAGRPPLVGRSAIRARILGAAARDPRARGRRRARPVLSRGAASARDRARQAVRPR